LIYACTSAKIGMQSIGRPPRSMDCIFFIRSPKCPGTSPLSLSKGAPSAQLFQLNHKEQKFGLRRADSGGILYKSRSSKIPARHPPSIRQAETTKKTCCNLNPHCKSRASVRFYHFRLFHRTGTLNELEQMISSAYPINTAEILI